MSNSIALRGVGAGSLLEFCGYTEDVSNASGVFSPGELLVCLQRLRDYDAHFYVYECVRAHDYESYMHDSTSVDGDQLVAMELKAFPKSEIRLMVVDEAKPGHICACYEHIATGKWVTYSIKRSLIENMTRRIEAQGFKLRALVGYKAKRSANVIGATT